MFKAYDPGQRFLLPLSVEDFVSKDDLARVINVVVNRLDLRKLYARYSELECNAYHP